MPKNILQSGTVKWLTNPAAGQFKLREDVHRLLMIYDTRTSGQIRQIFELTAPGAALELLLLVVGGKKSSFDLGLEVRHLAPATRSVIAFKALMFDNSSVNFMANVLVPREAHKSDTFLRCDSLLLSPKASARTVPALEIIANDVKAGHAATVGRPDEDQLFYLQTRGFSRQSARNLLVESFIHDSLKVFSGISAEERKQLPEKLASFLLW